MAFSTPLAVQHPRRSQDRASTPVSRARPSMGPFSARTRPGPRCWPCVPRRDPPTSPASWKPGNRRTRWRSGYATVGLSQCRRLAETGGTITEPPVNATASQIIQLAWQANELVYPYAAARANALPAAAESALAGLLAQADSAAGGDATRWLESHIRELERLRAPYEAEVGNAAGFAPPYPVQYLGRDSHAHGLLFGPRTHARVGPLLSVRSRRSASDPGDVLRPGRSGFRPCVPPPDTGDPDRRSTASTSRQATARCPISIATDCPTRWRPSTAPSTNDADSDDDGVLDGAEVRQGTDPLDNRPARTGVIRSLDTPGTALDVCVDGERGADRGRSREECPSWRWIRVACRRWLGRA